MKKSAWIIAIIALTISACTSQKQATSYVGDDVYNSSSQLNQGQPTPTQAGNQQSVVIAKPDNVTSQKPASSTFEDDYNDYSYTSRINRFSSKDTTVGYFDDSYAVSGENQSSNEPDVNISLGFGAGYGGYYGSSFSYGMGWGYPYSYWGWDYGWGWGYPYYYGGYSPWYNPWYYPCCYCYGYNDWYDPYYAANTYYGARTSTYRTDGGASAPNGRSTPSSISDPNNRIEKTAVTPVYSRNTSQPAVQSTPPNGRTIESSARTSPAGQEKYRYTRPTNEKQPGYQRTTTQRTGQVQSQTTRQQPAPRYTRPENVSTAERSGSAQSYSSPAYRQPKSSQEYLTHRSQNPGTTRVTNQNSEVRSGSSGTVTRQNSTSGNNRTYSTPSRSGASGTSPSSRSNYNNTAPVRSGSSGSSPAPSRSGSGGSYSAPSNSGSGGSYSAPSRSGGGSGSTPSGGSGSSGGGRRR